MAPKLELVKPYNLIEEPDIQMLLQWYKEFHTIYDIDCSIDTQNLYVDLIEEEHEEWIEEFYAGEPHYYKELKELTDLLYVTIGLMHIMQYKLRKAIKFEPQDDYCASITDLVADIAMGDKTKATLGKLVYAIFGYADTQNWNVVEAFKRVHTSNLSKLDDEGKPIRREDGKVTKGPNYQPPDLRDLTDYE